jgi:spermidine/putrescine transport system permease protein
MAAHRFPWHTLGRLWLAAAIVLMYAPVAMVFIYSFNASRIGSVWTGFSLEWYGRLWEHRDLWAGLRISVLVGLAASTGSVGLGLLAAWGLRGWRARTRRLAHGLLALPLVVPDMIMAISLAVFFHAIGMERGLLTIVLAHVSFGVSYAFVVLSAAVEDFDETLIAAALDCGATPWQAFWRVTAPILAPSLLVAWLLVFALSFDDFLITFFTKGVGSDTLPIEIYGMVRFSVPPTANAMMVVMFLVTLTLVLIAGRLSRRSLGPAVGRDYG